MSVPPLAPQGSYARRLQDVQSFRASNPAPRQVGSPRSVSSSVSTLPTPETIEAIKDALIPIFENASKNPSGALEVLEYCFINPSNEKIITLEKASLVYSKTKTLLTQAEKNLEDRAASTLQLEHHRRQESTLENTIQRYSLTSGGLETDDEKGPDLFSLTSSPEETPSESSPSSISARFRSGYRNFEHGWNRLVSSRDSHAESAHQIEQRLKTLPVSHEEATRSVEDLKMALGAVHETFITVLSTDLKTEQQAQEFLGRLNFAKSLYR